MVPGGASGLKIKISEYYRWMLTASHLDLSLADASGSSTWLGLRFLKVKKGLDIRFPIVFMPLVARKSDMAGLASEELSKKRRRRYVTGHIKVTCQTSNVPRP